MVAGEGVGPEGFGRVIQNMDTLFYADNRLFVSARPDRLNKALDVLMGLFDRVGLKKCGEDGSYGMPTVKDRGQPVGGGIQ